MAEYISGSKGSADEALADSYMLNAQMLGGIVTDTNGRYESMPVGGATILKAESAYQLSGSFSGSESSIISALNFLHMKVQAADTLAELTDVTLSGLAEADLFIYDKDSSTKWENKPMSGDAAIEASGEITLTATNTSLTSLANLVTVGTIGTGVWQGTDVGIAYGGTGASTAAAAATALGVGTGDSPQFTAVNVGHASDSTLTRASAGLLAVEGVAIPTISSTNTLTNKTLTAPTINGAVGGTADSQTITALTTAGITATANIDIGAFSLTAKTLVSDVATGTAPFTVSSTTNVANLNASSLAGATFAAPGAIGGTTAGTAAFTTITAGASAFTIDAAGVLASYGASATFGNTATGASNLIIAGKDASNAVQEYKLEVVGGILRATEQ